MAETAVTRKLAAILYADVAGYSRLTGEDEEGTHRRLAIYLDAITNGILAHKGSVVHFAGDAVLAEFASVVAALTSAVAIQRDLKVRNEALPDKRKLQFRIGINLGDVIVDRNDIYGDGVNIAARLENLADAGGICISQQAFDQVENKLDVGFEYLGERTVKNIEKPVRAYRVLMHGKAVGKVIGTGADRRAKIRTWLAMLATAAVAALSVAVILFVRPWDPRSEAVNEQRTVAPLADKPSIAVLPFTNLSNDQQQEYFSDGVTNDIITDLSKFASLSIIASNTVFTYKGKPVKVQDVGRELRVRYVLEGSVQQAGERVRINVQLIDAAQGHHLWGERYDRARKDLFALQNEIVQTIVSALAVKVSAAERDRALRKDTANLEAYDYLLRGSYHLERTTRAENEMARQMFAKAIELDPRHALAYVGLGKALRQSVAHGWTEFPNRALQQARDLAQKALSFEESADAHTLLAHVYTMWTEFDLASQEARRAIELNPNDWESRATQANVLLFTGRPDDAIQAFETVFRFNPTMDSDKFFELSLAFYVTGRYGDSIKTLEQSLGRNPNLAASHAILAAAYAQVGRADDAAREAATVLRLSPFFDASSFGDRFRNPADRAKIADGLRKAGLE